MTDLTPARVAELEKRARGVLTALERQPEPEPWLTAASLRVLANENLALLAERETLREARETALMPDVQARSQTEKDGGVMSFWDEEAGYDIRSPKHPLHANAGRNMGDTTTRRKKAALSQPRRFLCTHCQDDFDSPFELEVHLYCEHEGDAA